MEPVMGPTSAYGLARKYFMPDECDSNGPQVGLFKCISFAKPPFFRLSSSISVKLLIRGLIGALTRYRTGNFPDVLEGLLNSMFIDPDEFVSQSDVYDADH